MTKIKIQTRHHYHRPNHSEHQPGDSVMVELKFYRSHDGVRPKAVPFIRLDIEKIEQLVK